MVKINFDPTTTRPYSGSFQLLPPGEYNVKIVNEEEQLCRDGRSRALVFEYSVIDGEHQGHNIRHMINLWNANEAAVSVAQSVLASIMNAIGLPTFMDTRELHNRPFRIRVENREWNDRVFNDVVDFMPVKATNSVRMQVPPPPPPQQGATGDAGPFWSTQARQ